MIVTTTEEHERRNNWLALGALFLIVSVLGNVMLLVTLAAMNLRC